MLNRLLLSLAVASTSAVAEIQPFPPILPNTVADPNVINDRFDVLREGVNKSHKVLYVKSEGTKLGYAFLWGQNVYMTLKGYWFHVDMYVDPINPVGRLYALGRNSGGSFLDSQCEGDRFTSATAPVFDDYPALGTLNTFSDSNDVWYASYDDYVVVSTTYSLNSENVCVASVRPNGRPFFRLKPNDPFVTGWSLGAEVPSPSIGS